MSELFVVAFDNEFDADETLLEITKSASGYHVNLEYAAVLIRKEDGQTLIKQTHPLNYSHAAVGSFWGLLIGTLFLHPIAGIFAGGAVGAMSGSLKHIGIDDEFIKSLGEEARPGSSILFFIEHEATPSSISHELEKYHGTLLRTSFDYKNEKELRRALDRGPKR